MVNNVYMLAIPIRITYKFFSSDEPPWTMEAATWGSLRSLLSLSKWFLLIILLMLSESLGLSPKNFLIVLLSESIYQRIKIIHVNLRFVFYEKNKGKFSWGNVIPEWKQISFQQVHNPLQYKFAHCKPPTSHQQFFWPLP